jgi:hypothetical protein
MVRDPMGLLFWKNDRKIDAFANALANDLYSFVRPEMARDHFQGRLRDSKKKQHKVEQRLSGMIYEMKKFIDANSLGIYGKARLQKQFSDRLTELGYDASVTRQLVETILLRNL